MEYLGWQPIATALAGIAALIAVIRTMAGERHPLTRIERLTAVAKDVDRPAVRLLIEDFRDEQVTSWVLQQRAPARKSLLRVTWALRVLGVATLTAWALARYVAPFATWPWALYFVGVAAFPVSRIVADTRRGGRSAWARQERAWRGLPEPEAPRLVRKRPPQARP